MKVIGYYGSNLVIQVGPVSAGGSSTCLLGAKFMSATIELMIIIWSPLKSFFDRGCQLSEQIMGIPFITVWLHVRTNYGELHLSTRVIRALWVHLKRAISGGGRQLHFHHFFFLSVHLLSGHFILKSFSLETKY